MVKLCENFGGSRSSQKDSQPSNLQQNNMGNKSNCGLGNSGKKSRANKIIFRLFLSQFHFVKFQAVGYEKKVEQKSKCNAFSSFFRHKKKFDFQTEKKSRRMDGTGLNRLADGREI